MKNRNCLTRVLVMCLICILVAASTPLAYAGVTPAVPMGVTDLSKPHLETSASVSGGVYTGNEFSIDYNVYAKGTLSGSATGIDNLQNALIIVPDFSRNEQNAASLKDKNSRFVRPVLKTIADLILQARGNNNCKIGFMKMGSSTVLQTFKLINKDYLDNTIEYSNTDNVNLRRDTYTIKYGAASNTNIVDAGYNTSVIENGITYNVRCHKITKTANIIDCVDKDMKIADTTAGVDNAYGDVIKETLKAGNTRWSIKSNIYLDMSSLFSDESNVVTNDYGETMQQVKAEIGAGTTKVYCVLDGYSLDQVLSTTTSYAQADSVGSGSSYQKDGKNYVDDTGLALDDAHTKRRIYTGTRIKRNASDSYRYISKIDAEYAKNPSNVYELQHMALSLISDNINSAVNIEGLYVNKDTHCSQTDADRYSMSIDYAADNVDVHGNSDTNKDLNDSNWEEPIIGGDWSSTKYNITSSKTINFEPSPCKEDEATGNIISVDDKSIKHMMGITSKVLTNVRLEQYLPQNVKATDTTNGWKKTDAATGKDAGDVANDVYGSGSDSAPDYGTKMIRTHLSHVDYSTTPASVLKYHLKVKIKKSGTYTLHYVLKYKDIDAAETERKADFYVTFAIGSSVKIYYADNKEIKGRKGTQNAVYLNVYSGTQKISNMAITLKATNTTDSKNKLLLNASSAKIIGGAPANLITTNFVAATSTVDASTYYVIEFPSATTLDANTIKQIKIIYTIDGSSAKFDKGNLEIVNIQFDAEDCDPNDTITPFNNKDKTVITYNKVIIQ